MGSFKRYLSSENFRTHSLVFVGEVDPVRKQLLDLIKTHQISSYHLVEGAQKPKESPEGVEYYRFEKGGGSHKDYLHVYFDGLTRGGLKSSNFKYAEVVVAVASSPEAFAKLGGYGTLHRLWNLEGKYCRETVMTELGGVASTRKTTLDRLIKDFFSYMFPDSTDSLQPSKR
jgi:hypothetical protein